MLSYQTTTLPNFTITLLEAGRDGGQRFGTNGWRKRMQQTRLAFFLPIGGHDKGLEVHMSTCEIGESEMPYS